MNLIDYYFNHCIPTGLRTIRNAFLIWKHLMTSDYAGYALRPTDDPYQECRDWFWVTLGEDNVYPKAFLEELYEMIKEIESSEQKAANGIPSNSNTLNKIFAGDKNEHV